MFTPSERKALKGVINMSNLSITDHFIGPADLVTNMENYAVHMNSLYYDKKDKNVYDALPPKYHDFADSATKSSPATEQDHVLHSKSLTPFVLSCVCYTIVRSCARFVRLPHNLLWGWPSGGERAAHDLSPLCDVVPCHTVVRMLTCNTGNQYCPWAFGLCGHSGRQQWRPASDKEAHRSPGPV